METMPREHHQRAIFVIVQKNSRHLATMLQANVNTGVVVARKQELIEPRVCLATYKSHDIPDKYFFRQNLAVASSLP